MGDTKCDSKYVALFGNAYRLFFAAAAADRARPVLGAFFAPVLIADPSPAVVSQHAAIARLVASLRLSDLDQGRH